MSILVNDYTTNPPGSAVGGKAFYHYLGKGIFGDPIHGVKASPWHVPRKDFDYDISFDYSDRPHFRLPLDFSETKERPDLHILDKSGRLKVNFCNALTCLQFAPEWQGVLAYYAGDSMMLRLNLTSGQNGSNSFYFLKPPPWASDDDRVFPYNIYYYPDAAKRTAEWIERKIGIVVSPRIAASALVTTACTAGARVHFKGRYPMGY